MGKTTCDVDKRIVHSYWRMSNPVRRLANGKGQVAGAEVRDERTGRTCRNAQESGYAVANELAGKALAEGYSAR